MLLDNDCIEFVKTEPRRGAVEHYYRATARAFLADRDWRHVPNSLRPSLSGTLLQTAIEDAVEALTSERFDARDERHLSWTPMVLDQEGWTDLTDVLADTLEKVLEVQSASAARLAESGEEGSPVTTTILAYEAAPKS